MLKVFEECDNCGVDSENVVWREIEWSFTDVPENVEEAKSRRGKVFVCTECGHIHSLQTLSEFDDFSSN